MEVKIDGVFKNFDLESMNVDALLALKLRIEQDLDGIKGQIEKAEAETALSGIYSDIDWYHAANMARKIKGRQVQEIQLALKKRRAEKTVIRSVPDAFVDIARERLMPELFNEILEDAMSRYEGRYQ